MECALFECELEHVKRGILFTQLVHRECPCSAAHAASIAGAGHVTVIILVDFSVSIKAVSTETLHRVLCTTVWIALGKKSDRIALNKSSKIFPLEIQK